MTPKVTIILADDWEISIPEEIVRKAEIVATKRGITVVELLTDLINNKEEIWKALAEMTGETVIH